MASSSSLSSISRRIYRTLLNSNSNQYITKSFSTGPELSSELDELSSLNSDPEPSPTESPTESAPPKPEFARPRGVNDAILEGGLEVGIYKAIIVGQVGQNPLQKSLKTGRTVTITSIGTGGIRNERVPFPNEMPREYADRCSVQWHRVTIYSERLGEVVMKHAQPGTLLYVEGNLETQIFTDGVTGLVRRVREIAVRQAGRVVFLGGSNNNFNQPSTAELRGIGYF